MTTTTVSLPYQLHGLDSLTVPTHRLGGVFSVKRAAVEHDVAAAVRQALANPVESASLLEILKNRGPNGRVAIIVDDNTRPTPVHRILPVVLHELEKAGVGKENVSITVALGTHRTMTADELRARVGEAVFAAYRVENSHYYDPTEMVLVGTADNDVPIFIDRSVAEASIRIGIGSIVPHGAVGWSGGAKILFPGVAGANTVMRFHFLHGLSRENMQGRLECSVRLAMGAWVEKIGLHFIVNTVLDQDGRVCRVVAGHFVAAQRNGAAFGRQLYHHDVPRLAEVVVVVSHPHDADFWQAAKGIFAAEQLTADGGHLILVSPCIEGEGNHPQFIDRIGDPSVHELLQRTLSGAEETPEDPVSIAPACLLEMITRRITVHIVSPGIPKVRLHGTRLQWGEDVQRLVDQLLGKDPLATVAVVMHSDLSFAMVESPTEG